LVSPQAPGRKHARREGAGARQGLGHGTARTPELDDREGRSDRQSQGSARVLHRLGVRRLHRQHQSQRKPMKKTIVVTAAAATAVLVSLGRIRPRAENDPGSGDWPMWGGTPDRNMVSTMKGLPIEWDVKTKKNIKWVADLGSQSYGNPVVASRVVLVGTNNEGLRD